MLPCLSNQALKWLVGTADERYQIAPDYFRHTHYPQVLHRYFNHQMIEEVTEQELLEELLQETAWHNRLYMVFGSAGSGKSELLCWLKDRWQQLGIARPVIRISRSELNPQVLIRRCYEAIGLELDMPLDENRWDVLLQKPVTIVNQMIWTALAEIMERDEEIIPLALLLRFTIEKNIGAFSEQVKNQQVSEPLSILSRDQFEQMLAQTTVPLSVDYAVLHQSLTNKLDQFLFNGRDIASLFRHLSHVLVTQQIRPLLLIDDLVQSLNLYANELLDHLLNLEEGNWDVVIGLTPGVLRDTGRGAELLHRIMNLDTIEDRVRKLWLTDDAGNVFYTLGRENVTDYMEQYLIELKQLQGFVCNKQCPHAGTCSKFLTEEEGRLPLLPFNRHLIRRLYDGIPEGKGKLRYMILHAKEVIRFLRNGKERGMKRVQSYVERDCYVEHPNPLVKMLSEWYAAPDGTSVQLPIDYWRHFQQEEEEILLPLRNMGKRIDFTPEIRPDSAGRGESKDRIRAWVEGEDINSELLEPIRTGVATLVQEVVKATAVMRPFTSRQTSILQRAEVENRVRYPISYVRSSGRREEIVVERNLCAYDIAGFQQEKVQNRGERFATFAGERSVAEWIYQGERFREQWRAEIEFVLGMSMPSFVFQFREWTRRWQQISRQEWAAGVPSIRIDELGEVAEQLFLDWFLLRENLVDGMACEQMTGTAEFERWLAAEQQDSDLTGFRLGNRSAAVFLAEIKQEFCIYRERILPAVRKMRDQLQEMLPQQVIPQIDPELSSECLMQLMRIDQGCQKSLLYEQYARRKQAKDLAWQHYQKWLIQRERTMGMLRDLQLEIECGNPDGFENLQTERQLIAELNRWKDQCRGLEMFGTVLQAMPRELVQALHHQDEVGVALYDSIARWSIICAEVQELLQGNHRNPHFFRILRDWGNCDFKQMYENWQLKHQQRKRYLSLLRCLTEDRGWDEDTPIQTLGQRLRQDLNLSLSAVQVISGIVELGSYEFVEGVWQKIIPEIETKCPSFYRAIRIQLTFK